MIYGLYLSAQGAQVQSLRQQVVANNVANSSTTSFKRDLLRAQAHLPFDAEAKRSHSLAGNLAALPGGVTSAGTATDFSQGTLMRTGAPLDLALAGGGFLQVSDGKRTFLTRDGRLAVNSQNQLVMRDSGQAVLSADGAPISGIDPALPVEVRTDGSVAQQGTVLARLALVEPASYDQIQKAGNNLYTTTSKLKPADPQTQVKQGHLENSGASPITGMMELIESARAFEANVNMIRNQDETLSRLLASMPRR
jgi:flagellar basal body rod protein FlgG